MKRWIITTRDKRDWTWDFMGEHISK